MDTFDHEQIANVFQKLKESKFWGSFKFSVQNGDVVSLEIIQTLKRENEHEDILIDSSRFFDPAPF